MFMRANNPRDLNDENVDLAMLEDAAGRLSAAGALHEVLDQLVSFVTAVVKCHSCMVYVLEKEDLVLRASKNPHPEVVDRLKIKMGQGITGWVAENREPVAIRERAYQDSRFKVFNDLPEDRFESFLSVPVVSGGRLVGVINVQNRRPHEYTKREITLIATIGVLVGAEIERVRLESENTQLLDKLEMRTLVDRAKGILQRELSINEQDAYRIMQRESQQRRKSMGQIAEAIVLSDEMKRPSK
jgi:uroporphyrinogen-III synthase